MKEERNTIKDEIKAANEKQLTDEELKGVSGGVELPESSELNPMNDPLSYQEFGPEWMRESGKWEQKIEPQDVGEYKIRYRIIDD